MTVRSKICGITNADDGKLAAEAGCDAIGLVFYEPSPRCVTIEQALDIVSVLPPFVSVVALFVDASPEYIIEVLTRIPVSIIQFHGDESHEFCERFNKPYIKAIRVSNDTDVAVQVSHFPGASGFLLDSYKKGVPGGTGETFNWDLIPDNIGVPVILAGGLTADNIIQAIERVRPYGVDVSGGVERSKGVKDHGKVRRFLEQVRSF
jgi:phosphoribosylanthranilate isomerase